MNKEMKQCPGCIKMLNPTVYKFRHTAMQMFTPDCPLRECMRLDGPCANSADTTELSEVNNEIR